MGSTHVVEQLLFSIVPSILTFDLDFDLILGSFLTFWGPNGLFLGSGYGSKTVLGSPHINYLLLLPEYCFFSALSCRFEFLVVVGGGGGGGGWFPAIS